MVHAKMQALIIFFLYSFHAMDNNVRIESKRNNTLHKSSEL